MKNKKPTIIIQFNEANLDLIKEYTKKYNLTNFKKIFNYPTLINTTSETEYSNLEPWIQWYSFYTNMSFNEHLVFHLGDAQKNNHKIFLEHKSNVGIFGSMNIPKLNSFKIFIPDAWSESQPDKSISSRIVTSTLSQIVNDNSKLKISINNLLGLFILIGIPRNYFDMKMISVSFINIIKKSRSHLAALFDYFFLKYAMNRTLSNKLDVSMIFLNGFAHVQHHHYLDSEFIDGKNPSWYSQKKDHIKVALNIYDNMFGNLIKRVEKTHNIWIITGLTQSPCKNPLFYWRLDNHKKTLKNFFDFDFNIFPRMTRDFEIEVKSDEDKIIILDFLNNSSVIDLNGNHQAFGDIDDKPNKRIFCSLVYDGNGVKSELIYKNKKIFLQDQINFIAIKNGIHDSKGWAICNNVNNLKSSIPIWELSKII